MLFATAAELVGGATLVSDGASHCKVVPGFVICGLSWAYSVDINEQKHFLSFQDWSYSVLISNAAVRVGRKPVF